MLGVVVGDGAVGKVAPRPKSPRPPLILSHLRRRAFSYLTRPTHFQYVVIFLFSKIILTIVKGGVYTHWCVVLEESKFHVN